MKQLRPQILLMLFTILGVTGFQVFWLKQTYDREKKSLGLKTDFAFRDAVLNLQAANLKLSSLTDTANIKTIRLKRGDSIGAQLTLRLNERKGMVSTINVISRKMSDSIKSSNVKSEILIRHDQDYVYRDIDRPDSPDSGRHMLQFLYGVDSLQKPINIKELNAAVVSGLQKQQANIPFTIQQADSSYRPDDEKLNEVAVGFAHPVIYRLVPGNTFFYLLKRISLPVLFSVLLTILTVMSFVLLYRNLRRQQQLTDIKNEFIANITHELKTPIATVSVAIEAMQGFDAMSNPDRAKEYLGIAGSELGRLSMMVDKVLRLSVFENKTTELKKEKFDIAMLVQEVMQTMKLQLEKYHAQTSFHLSGGDFMISADRMHIAGVLYNLVDNAIKYSTENPVIDISVIAEPDSVTVKIADRGIGIDPAYRNKIFEKFFRIPHGDSHNVKGYGLGLSYAAYITSQHGGSIGAESNGAAGAVFTIKLPRNEH